METIADSSLGRLSQIALHILLQISPQFARSLKFVFEMLGADLEPGTRNLDEGSPRWGPGTEQDAKPGHTFKSDNPNFHGAAVFNRHHDGSNAVFQKIGVVGLPIQQ